MRAGAGGRQGGQGLKGMSVTARLVGSGLGWVGSRWYLAGQGAGEGLCDTGQMGDQGVVC